MENPHAAKRAVESRTAAGSSDQPFWPEDAFSRQDETDDTVFYETDRFVQHLDSLALSTVEHLIGELIVEENAEILDLMASWDSHIPATLNPGRVVGLGLNRNELSRNPALDERCLHDLNKDPRLPFPDDTFDAVLNVVSVDYLTQPFEIFQEVGRILKPGGLFLVVFSNRMFEQKAVKIWRQSGEEERVLLVEEFFNRAGTFRKPELFVSKGKPRPRDDKYGNLGIPSDPIYAVYAEKSGGKRKERVTASFDLSHQDSANPEELQQRKAAVKHTLCRPHCGEGLLKWAVPQTPFTEWDVDFMHVCFNDECSYLVRGWEVMNQQGNRGLSYRFTYNSHRDQCLSIPVPNLHALKDGIID
jgi:SAM-dependent methyltransferase